MNWNKILLVLEREFLVRVKTKLFILSTLLVPFGFVAFIGISVAVQLWESDPEEVIAIVDESGLLAERIRDTAPDRYVLEPGTSVDQLRQRVIDGDLDGILLLDAELVSGEGSAELIYGGSGGLRLLSSVRDAMREVVREVRLEQAQVSPEIRAIFEGRVTLESRKLTQEGTEEQDDTAILSAVGFIMGLIIFIAIFSYGAILMRGVIEEKTSRIIEVIASSIKPMELLVGKILGITCVALLQFAMWALLIVGLSAAAGPVVSAFAPQTVGAEVAGLPAGVDPAELGAVLDSPQAQQAIEAATASGSGDLSSVLGINLPTIEFSLVAWFFVFFILGYFLYASLFAAIGSAVDSETDTQQLMTPVMLLIMFAYFFNVQVMQSPDTTLSTVVSLIPFFAPINMITRVAISEVPLWQVLTSAGLLVVTIWGILLLSARIYRVGILMFGKKAGFGDLWKWVRGGRSAG